MIIVVKRIIKLHQWPESLDSVFVIASYIILIKLLRYLPAQLTEFTKYKSTELCIKVDIGKFFTEGIEFACFEVIMI